jgi:hypothetical protein
MLYFLRRMPLIKTKRKKAISRWKRIDTLAVSCYVIFSMTRSADENLKNWKGELNGF